MRFQVLRSERLCFFGTEHAKGRKEGFERVLAFWSVWENSKYAQIS
jgi:hypothetical protein